MTINRRAVAFCRWVVMHLPNMLIKEPERVFISYASTLIGIIMLVPYFHPPSISNVLGGWLSISWAVMFIAGGLGKLVGLSVTTNTRDSLRTETIEIGRSLERLGASLIALATFIYAVVSLRETGLPALMTFAMFMGLAVVNFIRLVVSTAGHAELREGRL